MPPERHFSTKFAAAHICGGGAREKLQFTFPAKSFLKSVVWVKHDFALYLLWKGDADLN
jgi:hypothetical protein